MIETQRLREVLCEINELTKEAETLIKEVELKANEELVSADTAAEIIGVGVRQLHRIAGNPSIEVYKYNSDGSRKRTNRKTLTFYRYSELFKYNEQRENDRSSSEADVGGSIPRSGVG